MPGLLFNAILSAFFLVRVVKGPWLRYPHYVAAATAMSVAALLVLRSVAPGAEDSLIAGNLAGLAGAWLGLVAYDRIVAAR